MWRGAPGARRLRRGYFGPNVLLALRDGTGYADGQWNLPSGKLEIGEDGVSALVREAAEIGHVAWRSVGGRRVHQDGVTRLQAAPAPPRSAPLRAGRTPALLEPHQPEDRRISAST
ncbi:MAG: hypothetical protein LC808_03320 [Actinobacteria bacterium]|nr:hypothetical protein [Actinomycetota bacterium]